MSTFDLGRLPSGHLHYFPSITGDTTDDPMQFVAIGEAFAHSQSDGQITPAAIKSGADLSPSLRYWRGFARRYQSDRCLAAPADPQRPDPVAPLTASETLPLLMSAPPMRGAE